MGHYLDEIFSISSRYLSRVFSECELGRFRALVYEDVPDGRESIIAHFIVKYRNFVKGIYQAGYVGVDSELDSFVGATSGGVGIVWGDCLSVLRGLKSESVQLMVTSPPYYNARSYSSWEDLDSYLSDMSAIIGESYRVLDNHRVFVFNVSSIVGNDNRVTRSSWGKRKIPLAAYFVSIFEKAGFQFVDDFIWDKGEVESKRHRNAHNPYPLYQYPVNCYEHILVFHKHRLDSYLYPCPSCGCLKVAGNAYTGVGIKSWECKNQDCTDRSEGNRGKRFSSRHHVMRELRKSENRVHKDRLDRWRRDIVKIKPVFKINAKGDNTLGHTAPFPSEIPEYAVEVFSGVGEVVLDPFAGSFTTPVEAVKNNRIGVGIELNRTMFRNSIISNISKNLMLYKELDRGGL